MVHTCSFSTQEAEAGGLSSRPVWAIEQEPISKKQTKRRRQKKEK
jgi:hypothetical protein